MLDTLELVNLARQPPRGAWPSSHFPFSIHLAVKRISSNFINGLRRGEIPASRSGIDLRRRRINRVINRSSRSSLIKSSLVVAVSPFLPSRRVPPLPPSLDKRRKWNRGEADARKKKEREYSKERGRGEGKKGTTTAGPDQGPRRKDANQHANAPIRHVAKRLHQIKLRQIRLYTPLPRSSEPRVVQVVDKSVSRSNFLSLSLSLPSIPRPIFPIHLS